MSNLERRIVVFESRSRWEPELQRQFFGEPVRLVGCRSWTELSSLVSLAPSGSVERIVDLIVIDLPEDAADGLQWLHRILVPNRTVSVIVLCFASMANLEWPLRDAGVDHVVVGETNGERLARCCRGLLPVDHR